MHFISSAVLLKLEDDYSKIYMNPKHTNYLLYVIVQGTYFLPIASNSSINIIAGCFSLAIAKASRTSLAPSPINICTSCGPANFKNVDLVCAAQARASRVLPVPGGPYNNTPARYEDNSLVR